MTFADQTLDEFLGNVAASTVTPSGGAVAAVGGASGTALCEMVCIHTIEKNGYDDVRTEFTEIRDDLETRRIRLLELADEDSMAVEALQAAFETPDEPIGKKARRAAEVPLEIAETCLTVIEHGRVITKDGNANAVADAGAGVFLAQSALRASVFTVRTNLQLLSDTAAVTRIEDRVDQITGRSDEAFAAVQSTLDGVLESP